LRTAPRADMGPHPRTAWSNGADCGLSVPGRSVRDRLKVMAPQGIWSGLPRPSRLFEAVVRLVYSWRWSVAQICFERPVSAVDESACPARCSVMRSWMAVLYSGEFILRNDTGAQRSTITGPVLLPRVGGGPTCPASAKRVRCHWASDRRTVACGQARRPRCADQPLAPSAPLVLVPPPLALPVPPGPPAPAGRPVPLGLPPLPPLPPMPLPPLPMP
jgi:hypothetical protein